MKHFQNSVKLEVAESTTRYETLDIELEHEIGLAWYYMHPKPRPCVTPALVRDIQHWFGELSTNPEFVNTKYVVLASKMPGIFNLGGDLNLFLDHIREGNREGLFDYAVSCIDTLMPNHTGLDGKVTTISLVTGDALGGGFEYALSSHVLIAERSSKLGLPDILFNLFPGAGAYSLLSRKVGVVQAEKMILSGKLYTAEELFELGVVDVLAENGQGAKTVRDHVNKERRLGNGIRAFRKTKQIVNPVTRDELVRAAEIWADAAFNLEQKDLRMMERLIARQNSKV